MKLEGRVALVFGAGSSGPGWGNGKAAAVQYAREGVKVVCVDVIEDAAKETQGIIAEEGGTAIALRADVTSSPEVKDAVDRAVALFDGIDVLHNNVGIGEAGGPVDTSEESWRRVLDTNLTSIFLTTKHVLPIMERRGGGESVHSLPRARVRQAGDPRERDTPRFDEHADDRRAHGEAHGRERRGSHRLSRSRLSDGDEAKCITGACLVVDGGLSGTAFVSV